jgi:citrate synthase
MSDAPQATGFKPKKSVALSGTAAGNTALCTVGRSGNDLHYRGYDIMDLATSSEFEEMASCPPLPNWPDTKPSSNHCEVFPLRSRRRWSSCHPRATRWT